MRPFLTRILRPKHRKQDNTPIVDLYLNLVMKILCGIIYEDAPLPIFGDDKYNENIRKIGLDWPSSKRSP